MFSVLNNRLVSLRGLEILKNSDDQNPKLIEQILWFLANVAPSSASFRTFLISNDIYNCLIRVQNYKSEKIQGYVLEKILGILLILDYFSIFTIFYRNLFAVFILFV